MVKVNIRRYEAPVTHRVLVELEDGVCGASAKIQNVDGDTPIHSQTKNTEMDGYVFEDQNWDN